MLVLHFKGIDSMLSLLVICSVESLIAGQMLREPANVRGFDLLASSDIVGVGPLVILVHGIRLVLSRAYC